MADNTPVAPEKEAPSAPEAAEQNKATTQEEVEIPKFAKGTEAAPETEVAEEPKAEEAPAPQNEEEATQKKRLDNAISEVVKRNEEVRRMVEMQADFVKENNELIHKIAANDPNLANRVVEKVWGITGIKSYKQLLERSKLEAIKETDPEGYETKRKLLDTEARLATIEEKEQKSVKAKFLESKGILENEYDPNYIKFNEAFGSLNPTLISGDYEKACKAAFSVAFAEGKPVPKQIEAPVLQVGGGKKPAPIPAPQSNISEQSSWLAKSLNNKLGYKIQL